MKTSRRMGNVVLLSERDFVMLTEKQCLDIYLKKINWNMPFDNEAGGYARNVDE